jgi:hypothetical protein
MQTRANFGRKIHKLRVTEYLDRQLCLIQDYGAFLATHQVSFDLLLHRGV